MLSSIWEFNQANLNKVRRLRKQLIKLFFETNFQSKSDLSEFQMAIGFLDELVCCKKDIQWKSLVAQFENQLARADMVRGIVLTLLGQL